MEERELNKRKNIRRRRRRKNTSALPISGPVLAMFAVLCLLASLFVNSSYAKDNGYQTTIKIKAKDSSIILGEAMPTFEMEVSCEGDQELVLESETGYSVKDLLNDLQKGTGVTLKCETDGSQEGTFDVKPELKSEISTSLFSSWFGKVDILTEDGTFEVKNPIGEWDGEKFKRWDGTYVQGEFLTYRGANYYLDADGKKVVGWQNIEGSNYLFDESGQMLTGWQKTDGNTYYLGDDGKRFSGWLTYEGNKYYFDQDGKELFGEQKIGTGKYVFDENGIMISSEGAVDPDLPMVALTFDDGPGNRTMELLAALEQYQARATFFMLGQKIANYPDVVQKMSDIGCEMGNHTYDHANLTSLGADAILTEVNDTNAALAAITGQNATLVRPPYGSVNETVKTTLPYPLIFWSLDTLDWKNRDVQMNIDSVLNNVRDGDIILMHDIHSESVDAAIQLIPMLQERGYQLVTVSEMAEAKGIVLENGAKYGYMAKQN